MALVMARPWKDPKTGVWYLRQRTPRDLLARLKGQVATLPVGEVFGTVKIGDTVQVSLRTKDARSAKELHAVADAALRRFWEAQRQGPARLTLPQAVALAGKVYRRSEALENDPDAILVRIREAVLEQAAQSADPLAVAARAWQEWLGSDPKLFLSRASPASRGDLENSLGEIVDNLLGREGLVVDDASRLLLLQEVRSAIVDGGARLSRSAQGDFRPDPAAARFPEWIGPSNKPAADERLTVDELFERWAAYQADKLASNTIKRYSASVRSLSGFLKGREARSVTGDDLYRWAEHRRENEEVSARAINKNDLVAVSSIFSWAADRKGGRLVSLNPANGVRLDEPRAYLKRERTFRPEEVTAILRAAIAVIPDRKNPTFSNAKRWCPWLAAYSGARISELTYLTVGDIGEENGIPFMHFRKTKTGEPRKVPLHMHLIEQGFLDFVAAAGKGPLFYDLGRHKPGAKTNPAELRAQKVAEWVRKAVQLDMNVDPNHGWRHTWKTRALGAGIEERIRDATTGHKVSSVGRDYETPSLDMLAQGMERFPKYG